MNKKTLLQNSLAEIHWMLVFWLVCFLWVITYCVCFGEVDDGRELSMIAGIPSWVFWGIAVPWIVATVFSAWFALARISEDSLETAQDDEIKSQS